ncbi:PPC domain-containing DNA-binding protein [Polaromonas jejuensis]|uniref:PPC domain-containing DNA-binding protein n=1 Tax=Polaromonas jejuensis TaxID=457502 RepID=A0ABW0QE93_9BURK|nr:DUF296 domain-containing protein [Polaromonas jejuensis]
MNQAPSRFARSPRSRTLVHPGPFNPVRIQSKHCARGRHFRLALQPGLSLFDALVKPLASVGVENASVTILGGCFDNLDYCVAGPDPSRNALVAYTQPIHAGRAFMIFGNATLGKSASGQPIVHCHAALRTQSGEVKGGHILTQSCVVAGTAISALVTSLEGFELRVMFDPETNISLLQPQEVARHG